MHHCLLFRSLCNKTACKLQRRKSLQETTRSGKGMCMRTFLIRDCTNWGSFAEDELCNFISFGSASFCSCLVLLFCFISAPLSALLIRTYTKCSPPITPRHTISCTTPHRILLPNDRGVNVSVQHSNLKEGQFPLRPPSSPSVDQIKVLDSLTNQRRSRTTAGPSPPALSINVRRQGMGEVFKQ